MRRSLVVVGVLFLLSGCAMSYRTSRNVENPSYGQVQFDEDQYRCYRENPRVAIWGPWDRDKVMACMAARGWRPVSQ